MNANRIVRRLLLAGILTMPATAASADAIDGDWCSPSGGQHVRIEGLNVTTSSGHRLTGFNSRHAFSYVIPESDTGAGATFSMQLLNDDEAQVAVAEEPGEVWRRCQFNV